MKKLSRECLLFASVRYKWSTNCLRRNLFQRCSSDSAVGKNIAFCRLLITAQLGSGTVALATRWNRATSEISDDYHTQDAQTLGAVLSYFFSIHYCFAMCRHEAGTWLNYSTNCTWLTKPCLKFLIKYYQMHWWTGWLIWADDLKSDSLPHLVPCTLQPVSSTFSRSGTRCKNSVSVSVCFWPRCGIIPCKIMLLKDIGLYKKEQKKNTYSRTNVCRPGVCRFVALAPERRAH